MEVRLEIVADHLEIKVLPVLPSIVAGAQLLVPAEPQLAVVTAVEDVRQQPALAAEALRVLAAGRRLGPVERNKEPVAVVQ